MAFQRICELDIGTNNNLGVRISALNFNFEIERSVENEVNFAKINVFNAKKETRRKVLIKGNNIFLRAGYEDENNLGLIFSGIIQESTTKYEDNNYVTEIYAIDFGVNVANLNNQTVNINYTSNTPFVSIINDITTIMSVPVSGISNISDIILNNGFVYYGKLNQLIKQLQNKLITYNVGLYFDNGEMVLYKTDETPSTFGVVNLSPNSGLIGEVEEINDETNEGEKRIAFVSLLNPKLKPNTIVNIISEKINGGFAVRKVINIGSNYGVDEFVSKCEAIA